MDFEKYKIRLNVRAACLFEQLAKKSFFKIDSSVDDVLQLIYSSLIANNDMLMTYQTFINMLGNKKIAKWIENEYKKLATYNEQMKIDSMASDDNGSDSDESITMTEIASSLIMQHKIDPHYVMYEMELWEIQPLLQCADNVKKGDLIEKRFWTYMEIAPHIDTKKCKSPEKLLPFKWEEADRKKRLQEELKNNEYAVAHTIGRDIFGNKVEKEDGTE